MIIGLDCDGTCDPTLQAVADAVTAAMAVDPTPERAGKVIATAIHPPLKWL